jgi:hypothetical protein
VLGAARGPFAVILAFVVLVGFQRFNNAESSAEREADSIRTMFNTAAFLDAPKGGTYKPTLFATRGRSSRWTGQR